MASKTVDVEAIRARHAATTQGPWRWFGYTNSHFLDLMGRDTVMEFRRWGMQRAQPWFCSGGVLNPASSLAVPDTSPDRGRITEINHPDARFLAASWQDVADLLAEVDRLKAELRAEQERNYSEAVRAAGGEGA